MSLRYIVFERSNGFEQLICKKMKNLELLKKFDFHLKNIKIQNFQKKSKNLNLREKFKNSDFLKNNRKLEFIQYFNFSIF